MDELNEVVEKIEKEFKPISIFLHGSMATKTTNAKSDYEIGVIFENERNVSRSEIREIIPDFRFSIFPFRKQELLEYSIDIPFQKTIFINSLIKSAKTLKGEKIIENLKETKITTLDLLLDTRFNAGYALAAVQNYKNGNTELANSLFYKSCLFATRNLIHCISGSLEVNYDSIFDCSQKIEIADEYREVIKKAFDLRKGRIDKIDNTLYYKNVSYINMCVEKILLEKLSKEKEKKRSDKYV